MSGASGAPAGRALPPELLAILACPICKGPLSDTGAALRCVKCARDYPVKDGIPDLVPQN